MNKKRIKNILKDALRAVGLYGVVHNLVNRYYSRRYYNEQQKHKLKLSKDARLMEMDQIACLSKETRKLRVAFYVVFDSVFPAEAVMTMMKQDENFDVSLVAIPDTSRGAENEAVQLDKTYKSLIRKFGEHCPVVKAGKDQLGNYIDYTRDFDIVCSANPYHAMTSPVYTFEHAVEMRRLTFFVSYGYVVSRWGLDAILNADSANCVWKLYLDAPQMLADAKRRMANKGINTVLSGYAKMDRLADVQPQPRRRKKIIIAPHHTVRMKELPLSNFLQYSDFFLRLPKMFPEVDFVFRPHPLLRVTLERDDVWGKQKTTDYFNAMVGFENVECQNGGDYMETFVNSDGIIHDCGSFAAEYLYTGHPACFVLRDADVPKTYLNQLMNDCLDVHYKAFTEQDIIDFIENVVIAGNDPMKDEREKFAKEKLMFNYPHASESIVADIKKALGRK